MFARAQTAAAKLPVTLPDRAPAHVTLLSLALVACDPGAFDDAREQTDQARDASVAPVQTDMRGLDAGVGLLPGQQSDMDASSFVLPDGASADAQLMRQPPAAAPHACSDTATDPLHCGACGNACPSLPGATSACVQSSCVHSCSAGLTDCDQDLALPGSNGCEIALASSRTHCGSCKLRCDSPESGIAACEASSCVGYTPRVGTPSPQSNLPHGSASSGGPFDLACGVDEVLTGFDTAFDTNVLYGLSALCAPLRAAGAQDQPKLSLGSSHASPMVGAVNLAWTPPHVSFPCPAGMAVSSLDGTLWYKSDSTGTSKELSIKQLILTCSVLALDGSGKFSVSGGVQVSVGNNVGTVQSQFSDHCSAGSAVVAFKGRAGAWIDALQTECGVLRSDRAATSSHVSSAAEAAL